MPSKGPTFLPKDSYRSLEGLLCLPESFWRRVTTVTEEGRWTFVCHCGNLFLAVVWYGAVPASYLLVLCGILTFRNPCTGF